MTNIHTVTPTHALTYSIYDLNWYIICVLISSTVFCHTPVDTSMTLLDAGEPQGNYTCIDTVTMSRLHVHTRNKIYYRSILIASFSTAARRVHVTCGTKSLCACAVSLVCQTLLPKEGERVW